MAKEADVPEVPQDLGPAQDERTRNDYVFTQLIEERKAHEARGNDEAVKSVDEALERLGYRGAEKARETTRAEQPHEEKRGH